MLQGHTACFKTSISKSMEDFGFIRLATHDFGKSVCAKENYLFGKRNLRYQKMFCALEKLLKQSKEVNVVLDGTFGKRIWRKQVYELCNKHKADLFLLRCICSDVNLIRKRLNNRKVNCPENEAKEFIEYEITCRNEESIFVDNIFLQIYNYKVPFLVFDTATLKIINRTLNSPKFLEDLLKKCIKGVE
jgi:hypothetical protein